MFAWLKAKLLHYANSSPPWNRQAFYALKDRLLKRYATFRGHDLQIITKKCWGDGWWREYGEPPVPCGPKCQRCGGSGIFDQRWVRLEKWQWGRYTFHIPSGDTRKKPDSAPETWIHGLIEHPKYGRKSNEACLWLYLLCGEWKMIWHALRSSWCCGWYAWPLLNLQRITTVLAMKLKWRRCSCGRAFPTWGHGWMVCGRCRKLPVEIPF